VLNRYYYFNVFVDDEFEQDREVSLKMLKCLARVPFLFVLVGNCFGDIEQDDAPSTDDVGDEFCCCGDDEYGICVEFNE